MKKASVYAVALLMAFLTFIPVSAQSWNDLVNIEKDVNLRKYGRMVNGVEQNAFSPSNATGNEGEFISLDNMPKLYDTPTMMWARSADGDHFYRIRIDGKMLYLTGVWHDTIKPFDKDWLPYNGWIKMLSYDGKTLKTVDNLGTYRYFSVDDYE